MFRFFPPIRPSPLMLESTEHHAGANGASPEERDDSRTPDCFAHLNAQERDLIRELENAARRVSTLLEEKAGAVSRTARRDREATLGTARAALIHTRHAVEASGLKRRLSADQLEVLAGCGTVNQAH